MFAHFGRVNGEGVGRSKLEFAFAGEKINEFGSGHVGSGASAEAFFAAKAANYGVNQLLLVGITIALHHVENVVSVRHIRANE